MIKLQGCQGHYSFAAGTAPHGVKTPSKPQQEDKELPAATSYCVC